MQKKIITLEKGNVLFVTHKITQSPIIVNKSLAKYIIRNGKSLIHFDFFLFVKKMYSQEKRKSFGHFFHF